MVSLGRNLYPGDVFCTTTYRSLVRFSKLNSFGFQYAGSYSAEEEEDINLFRMRLEDTADAPGNHPPNHRIALFQRLRYPVTHDLRPLPRVS